MKYAHDRTEEKNSSRQKSPLPYKTNWGECRKEEEIDNVFLLARGMYEHIPHTCNQPKRKQ